MSTPILSKSDKRQYKVITLSNKLECLLVSDKEADKSAASMNVLAGCLQDPIERQGLAHYLEHMLFLGTEKYPNQAEYGEFIRKNGGMRNAYTDLAVTNYFFDISNSAMQECLDRFAQFFVAPLFDESCAEREINAVDSENQKNLLSDMWREFQLFRSTSAKDHPFNKFGTGNKETLTDPKIRDELLNFYKQFYSSNLMKLCVYGKEDLETLEKWVNESFVGAANHELAAPKIKEPAFNKEDLGSFWKIAPIKDVDNLSFIWVLENLQPFYKNQPGNYISHLLGHEGKNSLLSFLIDEGLALELHSGLSHTAQMFSEMKISIKLTKKGLKEYEKVIRIVFEYLRMLRDHGVKKYIWEELKAVKEMRFNFKDKENPMNYVMSLSNAMQLYPTEDVVRHDFMMEEFDADHIAKIINNLTLDNLRISLVSKSVEEECKLVEKWYGTKYAFEPFSNQLREWFEKPDIKSSKSGKVLDLPPENLFIPKNFEILEKDVEKLPKLPEKIYETERSTLWFKQDTKFLKPKATLKFEVYSNDHGLGSFMEPYLLCSIWTKLLNESLRELKYEIEMASLSVLISQGRQGLFIAIQGFNDSMPSIASVIFEKIVNFDPREVESQFDDIVFNMIRERENFSKQTPYLQALNLQPKLLVNDASSMIPEHQIPILKKITFEKVLNFHSEFLRSTWTEGLIMGNIAKDTAINIIKSAETILSQKKDSKALSKHEIIDIRVAQIPTSSKWFFDYELKPSSSGEKEPNSCLYSTYQVEEESIHGGLVLEVLTSYVKEPCFDVLRTTEQLGYVVAALNRHSRSILNLNILIQSNVKCPHFLSKRVDVFLDNLKEKVEKLSDEDFNKYVDGVRVGLQQKDLSIYEESTRYWEEIGNHSYLFDRKEKKLEETYKLKKEEAIALFDRIFYKEKKLVELHVLSPNHIEENGKLKEERLTTDKEVKEIRSMESFKRSLPAYPDHYSIF